jgi:hypothetical protein
MQIFGLKIADGQCPCAQRTRSDKPGQWPSAVLTACTSLGGGGGLLAMMLFERLGGRLLFKYEAGDGAEAGGVGVGHDELGLAGGASRATSDSTFRDFQPSVTTGTRGDHKVSFRPPTAMGERPVVTEQSCTES